MGISGLLPHGGGVRLPVPDQPRPEGKHLCGPLGNVLLRPKLVRNEGFHAAVLIHGQGVRRRPFLLFCAVPGLVVEDLPVPDDDPRRPGSTLCLSLVPVHRKLAPSVIVVGNRQHHRVLRHQFLRLLHPLAVPVAGRSLACRRGHDGKERGGFGGPDVRHAVDPLFVVLQFIGVPGNPDGEIRVGISPVSVFLIFGQIGLRGVFPHQKAFFAEMVSVLFRNGSFLSGNDHVRHFRLQLLRPGGGKHGPGRQQASQDPLQSFSHPRFFSFLM